jgi:hypothetical protein
VNAFQQFLSREAGQERTRRRDEFLNNALDYFLGPTGIPDRLVLPDMLNPASDVGRAMQSSEAMLQPNISPVERIGHAGAMLTDVASVAAPAVATRMAGGDAAQGVMEGLLGAGGPTRQGLDDAARRFAADESGALTLGRADPAADRGAEVMQMLRSGRASEVTEDMLDLGDPVLNARLNDYLFRNYDLPMDEASRMARAGDTDAFHATRSAENFSQFRPGARGSIYMAATPEGAARGAAGQALEVAASNPISGTVAIMPLRINSSDVRGLTVNQSAYDALPDVLTESDVPAMAGRIKEAGLEYWDDAYEAVRFGDEYRYYKRDAPTARYQDLEPGKDAWGYRLGAFNTGSDLGSLARSADMGKKGFMVADEGGSSIVAGIDMPIRSRFARFDPRLAHLRNLSAGVGIGAFALSPAEELEAFFAENGL